MKFHENHQKIVFHPIHNLCKYMLIFFYKIPLFQKLNTQIKKKQIVKNKSNFEPNYKNFEAKRLTKSFKHDNNFATPEN